MPIPAGGAGTYAVTVDEVKTHLNITGSGNDAELVGFIAAAQDMVEGIVGPIVGRTIVGERHYDATGTVWLRVRPVLSVSAVSQYNRGILTRTLTTEDYDLDVSLAELNMYWFNRRYAADHHRLFSSIVVDYTAGRLSVPSSIRWGLLELVSHLWRRSQSQRGGRGRGVDPEPPVGMGFAMPNAVADALLPHALLPVVA